MQPVPCLGFRCHPFSLPQRKNGRLEIGQGVFHGVGATEMPVIRTAVVAVICLGPMENDLENGDFSWLFGGFLNGGYPQMNGL